MHHIYTQDVIFFISLVEIHVCTWKIDDIEVYEHEHVSYVHVKPGLHAHWQLYELEAKDNGIKPYEHVLVLRCDCDSNHDTRPNAT